MSRRRSMLEERKDRKGSRVSMIRLHHRRCRSSSEASCGFGEKFSEKFSMEKDLSVNSVDVVECSHGDENER